VSNQLPDIGSALVTAITNAILALANIMGGVATALSQYASTIGTLLVIGGIGYLAWRYIDRIVPFLRGIFGRFF
jgi:hypothetical protein